MHIRQFEYAPDSTIKVNLTYEDDKWQDLPDKISLRNTSPKKMYFAPLKISYQKFRHLQEIKTTIEKEYHSYYDNLDHYPKGKNGRN